MLRALAIAAVLTGCGSATAKRAGQACVSSSECAAGLLCDTARHVCAGMGSIDAASMADAPAVDGKRAVDARPIDAPVPRDAPADAPADAPPD